MTIAARPRIRLGGARVVALTAFAIMAGCGGLPTGSTSSGGAPVSSDRVSGVPGSEASPSPFASPLASAAARPPDRVTWFQDGVALAGGSTGVELAARTFDLGIQAIEPSIGLLPDGAFAFQGWDRPVAEEQGTAHVFVGEPASGTWRDISASPAEVTHDPYLRVDPRSGRIFSASLRVPGELDPKLFCIAVSFSDDQGATWTSSELVCGTDVDRPRLIATVPVTSKPTDGPSVVNLCYTHARVDGQSCHRSLDGGRTFAPGGGLPADGCDPGPAGAQFGHLATDALGTLYLARISCRVPVVSISRNEGVTWEQHPVGPEGWNGFADMGVAVDAAGTVFALWIAADRLPYLASSTDAGTTWSAPLLVAPPGVTEVNLPVLEAGAAGHIAIGMLVSTDAPAGRKPSVAVECSAGPCRDPIFYESVTWHAALTISAEALAASPRLATVTLNEPTEPIVRGGCGPGRCKSNADFVDLVIDRAGAPWLAFVACPGGMCPTNARGAWASSNGMLGTVEGVHLR